MIEPLTLAEPPKAGERPLGAILGEIARKLEGIGLDRAVLAGLEKRDAISLEIEWPAAKTIPGPDVDHRSLAGRGR